ncbi:DUF2797 domain-containing protein [Candidatus Marinamargulisbacteria bacterium SCGC AAA071-K20]|nr:DUF2797 domain-containing protein [Candidatus Marinamargulisbacteria bacterium SCGC AAA071-K20]
MTTPLSKMKATLNSPIEYFLETNEGGISINEMLDKKVSITFQHKIECIICGKPTKKSFYQGHCYPCFLKSPHTAECVIKPELCKAHLGIGKDLEWEKEMHDTDHFVYLALTSGIKVGVTRAPQIPTRWIDQGAVKAIRFAQTPNRYLAGLIEIDIAQYVTDKTAWQRMLKSEYPDLNLLKQKNKFVSLLNPDYKNYVSEDNRIETLNFPQRSIPSKVKSVNFDKTDTVEGILTGIKGQYLFFDNELVLNIRRHGGYVVELSCSDEIMPKDTLF